MGDARMNAKCKCDNGHWFTSRVLEIDDSVNVVCLADEVCPLCPGESEVNFEIHGYEYEGDEDYD
jgi:hypothetical protein